jgi:hypothetical protein
MIGTLAGKSRFPRNGKTHMRKVLMIWTGVCAFATLWKKEAREDGTATALSPLIGALAIEAAILLLTRKRNTLLGSNQPAS